MSLLLFKSAQADQKGGASQGESTKEHTQRDRHMKKSFGLDTIDIQFCGGVHYSAE